jgi:hypothetical protein
MSDKSETYSVYDRVRPSADEVSYLSLRLLSYRIGLTLVQRSGPQPRNVNSALTQKISKEQAIARNRPCAS